MKSFLFALFLLAAAGYALYLGFAFLAFLGGLAAFAIVYDNIKD